jgi:hypothetical protein
MPQFDWDCWTDFMYDHHQVTIPKKIVFRLNDEHATVVERETAHARDTLGASVFAAFTAARARRHPVRYARGALVIGFENGQIFPRGLDHEYASEQRPVIAYPI